MLSDSSVINPTTAMPNIDSLNRIFLFQNYLSRFNLPKQLQTLISALLISGFCLLSLLTMPASCLADDLANGLANDLADNLGMPSAKPLNSSPPAGSRCLSI